MSTYVSRLHLCFILIGLSCGSQIKAEETLNPNQIVENIIQAYGGRTALERVKVLKHTGTIKSFRLGKTGKIERLFMLPGKLRVDINYPNGPHEQRITTPEGAWRDGRPATAPMHTAMELQAARFRLPLLLTQNPVTLLDSNNDRIQLVLELSDTTLLQVFIERQTWHITRSVGVMAMGGMRMEFTADYSDFRQVNGVLFAHREELMAMGMKTGIAKIEHIEVNPETRADDFTSLSGNSI